MTRYISKLQDPHPRLPWWSQPIVQPSPKVLSGSVTFAALGLSVGVVLSTACDAIWVGNSAGNEGPNGGAAYYTIFIGVCALLGVLGVLMVNVFGPMIWRPITYASYLHKRVTREYTSFSAQKMTELAPAYRAVMSADAQTSDAYTAESIFKDTSDAYDKRERMLRTEVINPHIDEARYHLESLNNEIKQLQQPEEDS